MIKHFCDRCRIPLAKEQTDDFPLGGELVLKMYYSFEQMLLYDFEQKQNEREIKAELCVSCAQDAIHKIDKIFYNLTQGE